MHLILTLGDIVLTIILVACLLYLLYSYIKETFQEWRYNRKNPKK